MSLQTTRRSTWTHIATAVFCLMAASCESLPDAKALIARHTGQAASFENAFGPVSKRTNEAIMNRLKASSGNLDILDKHIAVEEAVSGSPLLLGNKVTLLQDGPDTYQSMFAAVAGAQDHVNVEFYIIEDDEVGREFADLLLERQANGVQVNVIYDSVGCFATPKEYFDRLRNAGVSVLEFNPANPLDNDDKPWLLNNRDHRKVVIVDGKTAWLGGINISDVYSASSLPGKSDDASGPWRDTDLRIEGPAVGELQKLFMETWQKQKGDPLAERNYFPELQPSGNEIVRVIGSTPDDPYSLIYLTLMSAIANAEKQVYLTNAYFVPNPEFLKALTDAAARGVDVKLILPSHTDSALVFHAGRANYKTLLEGGVQIYEFQDALLHAKTAVIDSVWSTVGSSNLDWRSFSDNDEVNAIVLGKDFAMHMLEGFERDLAASREITPAEWKRRGPVLRAKETFATLWQRLL